MAVSLYLSMDLDPLSNWLGMKVQTLTASN